MIEEIVMVGVVGNFLLQAYWFYTTEIKGEKKHDSK